MAGDYLEIRIEEERRWWSQLANLANQDKPVEFFSLYARYLRASKVISPQRKILLQMAERVSSIEALKDYSKKKGFTDKDFAHLDGPMKPPSGIEANVEVCRQLAIDDNKQL